MTAKGKGTEVKEGPSVWVPGGGKARRRGGAPEFRQNQSGLLVCLYERVVVTHVYKDFIF